MQSHHFATVARGAELDSADDGHLDTVMEMVRMASDEDDRQSPQPARGGVIAESSIVAMSRGVSPNSQNVSAAATRCMVTPIAQLNSHALLELSHFCLDADFFGVSPERHNATHTKESAVRPVPRAVVTPKPVLPLNGAKTVQAASQRKATRAAANFAAFAASLPADLDRGDFRLQLTPDGAGGTYFVLPREGDEPIAVFKPSVQEIGEAENPRGNQSQDERLDLAFRPGDGYRREVLAFQLDHEQFAGVPETFEVTLQNEVGSLQRFVPLMMQSWSTTPGKFDTASVQRIAVFDIRTLNCDRHGGNLLVRRDTPSLCVVPIDHGYLLPEGWCDPDFEWAMWPQSAAAVSDDVRDYVARLDADADAALVAQSLGQPLASEVIAVTTRLLQVALRRGKQHTLRDIAAFCRRPNMTQPCGLESLMTSCRQDLDDGGDLDMELVMVRLEAAYP